MGAVIIGRVAALSAVTVAVAAGFVSLPALAALATTTGILGAFEVSGVLDARPVLRVAGARRGGARLMVVRPEPG